MLYFLDVNKAAGTDAKSGLKWIWMGFVIILMGDVLDCSLSHKK